MLQGRVLDRPGFLVNVPTVLDRTMAPAEHPDRHVLSLEVLYTPYRLTGGWPGSTEPARWLELLASFGLQLRRSAISTGEAFRGGFGARLSF